MTKMHVDEIDTDEQLVRRLVTAQLPQWADLPVERVEPFGTDNAIYRLGEELVVRLPRREHNWPVQERELEWLPRLAPHLPLEVPLPLAVGEPGEDFPFRWSVWRWLDGEPATSATVDDLAGLIEALWRIEPTGAPAPYAGRGMPLARRDTAMRKWVAGYSGPIDLGPILAVWEEALAAPEWTGLPRWLHGDLDARNVLARDGHLSGVLDWGCLGVGDPATDVMVAWKMLPAEERGPFRERLDVDDAMWTRARGWVVSQAFIALAYYTRETNAVLVGEAERWLVEALASE